MTDCDSTGKTVFGDLNGSGDVDFYKVAASDVGGCFVDPLFEMATQARLCVFFECTGLSVNCKGGSTPTTSPGGRLGCCIPNGGKLEATPNCSGSNDSTSMYFRVDQGPTDVCTAYSVKFHY